MNPRDKTPLAALRTFLGGLRRDVRANTLAIVAAALVPLAGMIGGGLDMSRVYLTKTRLQHACDAGALAGRKAMGASAWGPTANASAVRFFNANFANGAYGSSTANPVFTESAGTVTGTVAVDLPMTLMKILGKRSVTIPISCKVDLRIPNTDIMFVLDTTGSMGDRAVPTDSQTKIQSLKTAVKCFYEIVAKLDTDATCATGTPSGGLGPQTQVRFGFVPYATNVNVGKLLNTAWFADSANYQTREAQITNVSSSTTPAVTQQGYINQNPLGNWLLVNYFISYENDCYNTSTPDSGFTPTQSERSPTNYTSTGGNPNTVTWVTTQYGYYYNYRKVFYPYTCYIQRQTVYADLRRVYSRTDSSGPQFTGWRYNSLPVNVGLLKNGNQWRDSFQWPIGYQGAPTTINWGGCIEERQTVSQSGYTPIPAGAKDLDIDSVPNPADPTTQWRPVLPDLIYTRSNYYGWTTNEVISPNDMGRDAYYACPAPAKKLQQWPNPTDFSAYVDALTPEGNTYHDIGLIWGARLISPTGIFGSENAQTPQGGKIDRNIIFMTDGDACTGISNYTAYGVNWFDRRTTGSANAPTEGCTSTGTLTQQVNARTDALCTAIKNKNITLWVISFGSGTNAATETRLSNCATPGRYYAARDSAALQNTFAQIANQISQLRLTQ